MAKALSGVLGRSTLDAVAKELPIEPGRDEDAKTSSPWLLLMKSGFS